MAKSKKTVPVKQSKSLALKEKDSTPIMSTAPVQVNNGPDGMIMIALQGGRTMEEIGKLIEFRNNELARLAKLEFMDSKARFNKERKRIIKNQDADFGTTSTGKQGAKYKFENLDDIDDAIKDLAADCGFSWEWKTRYDGDYIFIQCILSHKGGHYESDEMRGKTDKSGGKSDIQADSSTSTYLMRYTLKKVLGLSSGKDDNDGHKIKDDEIVDYTFHNLPSPTDEQYNVFMRSVISGTITVDQIKDKMYLTADQEKALRIAEDSRKPKL